MVTPIPQGVFAMKERFAIIKHIAKSYKKATKKVKSQMIKELAEMFHMNKQYISYLLRNAGKTITKRGRVVVVADPTLKGVSVRGRKRVYGEDVIWALKYIWPLTGYASYEACKKGERGWEGDQAVMR